MILYSSIDYRCFLTYNDIIPKHYTSKVNEDKGHVTHFSPAAAPSNAKMSISSCRI